jgi:L-iditol 2-dehydrogenase
MAAQMKAAFLIDKRDLRFLDSKMPEPGEKEILTKVRVSHVCATDVRMWQHGHPRGAPLIPGHEFSGVIDKVGAAVSDSLLGTRVTVAPNMGCGACVLCRAGQTQQCSGFQALGFHLNGSFAEYVVIPEAAVQQGNVFQIPERLSFEEAALVEPLSCVLSAHERVGINPGEDVLIIGAGPIGHMHAKLATLGGAGRVFLTDLVRRRLQYCREIGPSWITINSENLGSDIMRLTRGRGVDLGIVACSSPEAQSAVVELAAINGRIVFFGGLPAKQSLVRINTNQVHYRQLILTGTTRSSLDQFAKAIRLLERGLIKVGDLISTRREIGQVKEVFQEALELKGLKHAVVFD